MITVESMVSKRLITNLALHNNNIPAKVEKKKTHFTMTTCVQSERCYPSSRCFSGLNKTITKNPTKEFKQLSKI